MSPLEKDSVENTVLGILEKESFIYSFRDFASLYLLFSSIVSLFTSRLVNQLNTKHDDFICFMVEFKYYLLDLSFWCYQIARC